MAQGRHTIVLAEGDHTWTQVTEMTVELLLGNEVVGVHYDTEHVADLAHELRKAADELEGVTR